MKITITTFLLFIATFAFNQTAYNAAESGLTIRQTPDISAIAIGKLEFGEKVKIMEYTQVSHSIFDTGKEIKSRWYKIASLENAALTGYVLSAYLTDQNVAKKSEVNRGAYIFTVSPSSKADFQHHKRETSNEHIWDEEQCLDQGLMKIVSEKEITVQLSNGTSLNLQQTNDPDEQFFGYTFLHYDAEQKLYFFWENWLEAGHPIMINAATGKIHEVMGSANSLSPNKNTLALFGEDIGAGWTPNGIELIKLEEGGSLRSLFTFDPREALEETWGPVDVVWENDSTLLIACLIHNADSGLFTVYKKLHFENK